MRRNKYMYEKNIKAATLYYESVHNSQLILQYMHIYIYMYPFTFPLVNFYACICRVTNR